MVANSGDKKEENVNDITCQFGKMYALSVDLL